MAYQALELGTAPDDGTGDSLRVGGDKLNDNFVELYTALGDGDSLSSGISASATVITLTSPIITTPVITEIDSGSTITLDATTDIILDADGGDIFFKDAGTTFGSATNTSGNLIIKSGTTTAATFAGANVTLAGTLGVGAITTTGAFKGADGYTIGNASVAAVMTLASTGIVTFADDILIKNDGTIGSAGAAAAMTISSAGIVTFVDDILIKDVGTIGSASTPAAMTIAANGAVTFSAIPLLPDNTVSTADIQADAITGAKIADDAINSEHYTNGSIDTAHIAADQIVASLIADNAINSEHYTDGSIDKEHLSTGARQEVIAIACGDESTAHATGTAVVTFAMPYAFTLTGVKASVTVAPVGSTMLVDINEAGTTILSTKLMIDASEKISATAATAAVISDTALADNALITIDIDQIGSSTAGAGLKVYLIGYAT